MNKADLVNVIAQKAGMTKVDAKKAVEAFMEASAEALRNGERISLVGFGTFYTSKHPERKGRNPQSGQEIIIPEKNLIFLLLFLFFRCIIIGGIIFLNNPPLIISTLRVIFVSKREIFL